MPCGPHLSPKIRAQFAAGGGLAGQVFADLEVTELLDAAVPAQDAPALRVVEEVQQPPRQPLLVRFLFHTFPLQKVYLEVPGFNYAQLASGEGRLFQVEGRLRDHCYYGGRYWDQYLCAIYRPAP